MSQVDPVAFSYGIGFSMGLVIGFGAALSLYIREICNSPIRRRIRKEAARKRFEEKEKLFLKSVNLDGIKIVEFSRVYEKLREDDMLSKEFNALLSRYRIKEICPNALLKQNENKNFFPDHLPFEDNVVQLEAKKTNYINASWIKGFDNKLDNEGTLGVDKMYIITQVPLKNTIMNFWRMIWKYNCSIIVMIGKEIVDNEVIENYINPELYNKRNSPFYLELQKKVIYSEFLKSTFYLHHDNEYRQIIHLQFVSWTHVSHTNAQVILELRRQMKIEWLKCRTPIVVHCLSGCGRSGTFVAICNLCDQIDEIKYSHMDSTISVAYEVINMREARMMSIANIDQYRMVYETIIHYIDGGVTVIPLWNLEEKMQFLSNKSQLSGLTRFESQFKNSNKRTRQLFYYDCAGGVREENLNKNRIFNVIPRDCDRPYLQNTTMKNSTDYINAVYVDTFNSKNHFLVTQWPLKDTTVDVWRLFYDKAIHIAVILENFEFTKTYPGFWPEILNQSVAFGNIAVKLVKDDSVADFIRCQTFQLTKLNFRLNEYDISKLRSRKVFVKSSPESGQWQVTFLHLLNWNSNKVVPNNLKSIIELIMLFEEFNTLRSELLKSNQPPVVLISKDGVVRCGVVCCISTMVETIRHCEDVDIYSSVINLKRNRPQLIPTIEEYLLCYELCLEYFIFFYRDMESQNDRKTEFFIDDGASNFNKDIEQEIHFTLDDNNEMHENTSKQVVKGNLEENHDNYSRKLQEKHHVADDYHLEGTNSTMSYGVKKIKY